MEVRWRLFSHARGHLCWRRLTWCDIPLGGVLFFTSLQTLRVTASASGWCPSNVALEVTAVKVRWWPTSCRDQVLHFMSELVHCCVWQSLLWWVSWRRLCRALWFMHWNVTAAGASLKC